MPSVVELSTLKATFVLLCKQTIISLTSGSTQYPGWQTCREARGVSELSCGATNFPTGPSLERARTASPVMLSEEISIANLTDGKRQGFTYWGEDGTFSHKHYIYR